MDKQDSWALQRDSSAWDRNQKKRKCLQLSGVTFIHESMHSQLKSSNSKVSIGFLLCIPAVFALVIHRLRLRLTIIRVIIEICHIKLEKKRKMRAKVRISELVRKELNSDECVYVLFVLRGFKLTWGSWLFVFILGFRQYSSNVSGTTIPSFSASTFDCNACFLFVRMFPIQIKSSSAYIERAYGEKKKMKKTRSKRSINWVSGWAQKYSSEMNDDFGSIMINFMRCALLPNNIWIFIIASVGVTPSAIHDARVDICRRKCVGFIEQRDDGEENRSHILCVAADMEEVRRK